MGQAIFGRLQEESHFLTLNRHKVEMTVPIIYNLKINAVTNPTIGSIKGTVIIILI